MSSNYTTNETPATTTSMTVRVRFFGNLTEHFADETETMLVATGSTPRDLRRAMVERRPAAASALEVAMMAVNQEYTEGDDALRDGDELAFLPPVSGG